MIRTVLVSGAGSGIGRAIAISLARDFLDIDLILLGRREKALAETKDLMARADRHSTVVADQSKKSELRKVIAKLELPSRNFVGLVANAGIGGENQYGENDRWEELIATNLSGTYYLINECLPALQKAKGQPRNIVILSSILARLGIPGYAAYCASKAGLLGLTRALAAAHAQESIYVNAICPGWVNTAMAKGGIQQFANRSGMTFEAALQAQLSHVPTGKMAEPEEVASLVGYLISGKQASFTGQCFDLNNGAVMP